MQKIRIDQDIIPLSEVRNCMAAYIKQIHETKRPLIITQRGKSAAVLVEYNTYPPDEFAARFHHKLVFIHPFSNGNGRHSRYMADLILDKIFKVEMFSWGGKADLTQMGSIRGKYIEALKAADDFDYSLLLKFVRS